MQIVAMQKVIVAVDDARVCIARLLSALRLPAQAYIPGGWLLPLRSFRHDGCASSNVTREPQPH